MGTGSQMAGSSMFVIYQSSNGQNVTLSPRTGTGHVEPGVDSSAQVSLMDGSGISGSNMIANIRCKRASLHEFTLQLTQHRSKLQYFNIQLGLCSK
jgi:Cytochrome domain of cellobiose dehydrogenase